MDRLAQDAHRLLNARRDMLLGTLRRQETEEAGAIAAEPRDRVAGAVESELRHHLADRELMELKDIDAALKRISEGSYGRCERCDHAIGNQRLRAVPEARLCLACSSARVPVQAGA